MHDALYHQLALHLITQSADIVKVNILIIDIEARKIPVLGEHGFSLYKRLHTQFSLVTEGAVPIIQVGVWRRDFGITTTITNIVDGHNDHRTAGSFRTTNNFKAYFLIMRRV